MTLFALALISLGVQAATIAKTNDTANSADNSYIEQTVIFTTDDFVTGSKISDVNISVNFEKLAGTCSIPEEGWPFNREIYAFLTSPTGTQVALIEDKDNNSDTTSPYPTYTSSEVIGGNVTILFDDSASTLVGGPAPTSGSYRPIQPLSAFIDENPVGTWTLTMGDSGIGEPLCFYEYTLTIEAGQPPAVDNQTFSVAENSTDGTSVDTVSATDPDTGDKLTYAITAGNTGGAFTINATTGEITVADGSQLDFETTPSYALTVQVTDSSGLSDTATITINVTNSNEAPTDIILSSSSVLEHQAVGTLVGNFSTTDPDTGDSHTYSLVSGAGDTGNGSFQIDENQLQTKAILDHEAGGSYSIRVRSTDNGGLWFEEIFTISITDGNDPPTDISLNNTSVNENQASGTAVGTLTSADNSGDTHTYTLVDGDGADDNASFQITLDELQTATSFDYEDKDSYSIRVRSTDNGSLWLEEIFTITIVDANDAPTDISLDSSSVAENQLVGTPVGNFSSTDQDTDDTHTYTLVGGDGADDNASFQIVGSQLRTNAILDYEAQSSYSIRVQTNDGNSGVFDVVFTITISDANDAPTDITLDNNDVDEHQPVGTLVGNFGTTDPDTGDSHTYVLTDTINYPDNTSFTISGGKLQTAVSFDFETDSSYSIRVQTNDGNGGTFSKEFTISITDGNDPPTDISLNNSSVNENQASGTAVGTFSSADNSGDTHTYTLVDGDGADDNASFQIALDELQTAARFDYEDKDSYSIRVRSTDDGNLWHEKIFTITIVDTNDAPTDISLDNSSVDENQPSGTAVGNFSSTDQDTDDTHTYTLVGGDGADDNASFQIDGSQLQTNAAFDREAKSSYTIRVRSTDNGTSNLWFEKVFTITITNENEGPTNITLDSSSVNENQPAGTAVGTLNTIDPDSGDSFTYSLVTGDGDTDNDSFQIVGSQLQTKAVFNFEDQSSYSIRVQTRDSGSLIFAKQFTITITDVNDPPVAVDDTYTTNEDTVLDVAAADGVLDNDVDEDLDTLSVLTADSTSTQGASVNVADDGGFTYDPTAVTALQALNVGQNIADTFTYTVRDGGFIFDTATVTITVTGVNDAPVANNDAVMTVLETAVLVTPLDNDTDPDTTDTMSLTTFTQGTHGTVTDNGNGTLTYTPETDYIGSDSFTYTIEDSYKAGDTATVNVTVNPKTYYVYLPVVLNNYTSAPDLVITSLQAGSDYVEVVIENQGSQATASGFWVDFYVDPAPAPTAANELWPDLSDEGIAWGVTTSILPGQTLTLIYSTAPGAPNLYYSAADSLFSGSLPVGTPIYAQVDSAHVGHHNGAIEENHEITGGAYNNIFQALATAVPAANPLTNVPAGFAAAAALPVRD